MKNNHDATKNKIKTILEYINDHAKTVAKYKTDVQFVHDSEHMYTQEYINEQLENLRTGYLNSVLELRNSLNPLIDEVEDLENENLKIVDYDVDGFNETVTAINSAHGNLSNSAVMGIIENFNGQYNTLQAIHTIFKKYEASEENLNTHENADVLFDEYLSPVKGMRKIRRAYNSLEESPDVACLSLERLFNAVVHFAKTHGMPEINDTLDSSLLGYAAEDRTKNLSHIMGISKEPVVNKTTSSVVNKTTSSDYDRTSALKRSMGIE